jgi:small subunit ribosomal protein S11
MRPNRDEPRFEPANIGNVSASNPDPVAQASLSPLAFSEVERAKGYFFVHAVATTRNIHVTITNYKKDPLVSVSAGQLGLKHAKRGTIEAGLDTTIKALQKFAETKYDVRKVEVVLKGFNKGRKGFLSALSGHHGDFLRPKVIRITDATPLRIGTGKVRNLRRR